MRQQQKSIFKIENTQKNEPHRSLLCITTKPKLRGLLLNFFFFFFFFDAPIFTWAAKQNSRLAIDVIASFVHCAPVQRAHFSMHTAFYCDCICSNFCFNQSWAVCVCVVSKLSAFVLVLHIYLFFFSWLSTSYCCWFLFCIVLHCNRIGFSNFGLTKSASTVGIHVMH